VRFTARAVLLEAGKQLLVFAAYYAAAEAGMMFALPSVNLSLVWPPTGVALALTYLLGLRFAGSIALSSMVVSLGMNSGFVPALAIAMGNSLGALAGAYLLRRRFDFSATLDRIRDVVLMVLAGALVSSIISSSVNAEVMHLAGLTEWKGFSSLWWVCWVADFMGILLVAPFILTLGSCREGRWPWPRVVEMVLLFVVLLTLSMTVYSDLLPIKLARPLSYAVFPVMIWTAVRFTSREVSGLLLVAAYVAVSYTGAMKGPFTDGMLRENLLSLHAHLGILALSSLLLAATAAEARRAEEKARQHLQELAHTGRISAMGEMAAGLAHELNQPLCAIMTFSQASLRLLDNPREREELRAALGRIVGNAERSADIIRQMRAFVRKGEPSVAAADINELVRQVVALTRADVRRHGVHLTVEYAERLPLVRIEAIQIQQVLVNLIRNAVDAIAASGTLRREVAIVTRRTSDGVEVCVADSGPGIDPAVKSELFEPFVTTKTDGLGLGLSISRSIVEAHGGRLNVSNQEEGGAVFAFVLPFEMEAVRNAG